MGAVGIVGADETNPERLCEAYTLFKDEGGIKEAGDHVTYEGALEKAQRRMKQRPPSDGSDSAMREAAAGAAAFAGLRAPSWTDRVLVYSLPGAKAELTLEAYEAPELGGFSDHQPVRLLASVSQAADRVALLADARDATADRVDVTISLTDVRVEGLGLDQTHTFDALVADLTSNEASFSVRVSC